MDELRFHKTGGVMRVFVTLLLLAGSVFAVAMGIFASQASELTCTNGTEHCLRQTRYPFDISFQAPVPAFHRVSLREKSGEHGTSLDLTLHHADGTATEYPGVGTNGDRAAATMEAIEAYMAAPRGTRTFPLRSGSVVVGAILVPVGLLLLLLIPAVFNDVCFTRRGDALGVRVERRPLRAREVTVPVAEVQGVEVISRPRGTQTVYAVSLVVEGRDPVDLGMGYTSGDYAWLRARALGERLPALLQG